MTQSLEAESVDAIVTDPPYMISFMGAAWDREAGNLAASVDFWRECLRVLKPGGHLLAFGATRTHHRLYSAIEDAGFRIVDTVAWVYGSGFPKHRALLKPAFEPICLAAKKGPRALNVDACRIPLAEGEAPEDFRRVDGKNAQGRYRNAYSGAMSKETVLRNTQAGHDAGRWPANLVHDGSDEALMAFPEPRVNAFGDFGPRGLMRPRCDTGSAARFFYCARASKRDREEGLDGLSPVVTTRYREQLTQGPLAKQTARKAVAQRNHHPTVKPTPLMRWLCRLVALPGGIVLDPFMGSGSTGKAALLEGLRCIGIEREPDFFEIAAARIARIVGDA